MEIYDRKHDFKIYKGKPEKIICVYFVPRSGSNFLAEEMRKTELLGYPLEYFSEININRIQKRLKSFSTDNIWPIIQRRTSPNGVFGYKWNSNFEGLPMAKTIKDNLEPNYRIFLDRKDHNAQAKSFLTAKKTGNWLESDETVSEFPYGDIRKALNELDRVREVTLKLLSGFDFKTIYFEDLIENSEKIILEITNDIIHKPKEPMGIISYNETDTK